LLNEAKCSYEGHHDKLNGATGNDGCIFNDGDFGLLDYCRLMGAFGNRHGSIIIQIMKKALVIGFAGVVLAGMGLSVARDYRVWKYEETKNFGHGPKNLSPAKKLDVVYQNDVAKIRIRYPGDWKVTENPVFGESGDLKLQRSWAEILAGGSRLELAKIGSVGVEVQKAVLGIVEAADAEERGIKQAGKSVGDRIYINTDKISLVVLTWQDAGVQYWRAMGVKSGRMVSIEMNNPIGEWDKYEATYTEMLKTVVII
jgi:hypothetical protein